MAIAKKTRRKKFGRKRFSTRAITDAYTYRR